MKKITALAMAAVIAASGCAVSSRGPVAAEIGGHKVTQAEISFYSDNYRFASNEAENSVTQAINSRLVLALCEKMGIETDDDDEEKIKSTLISLRKSEGGTSAFNDYLKQKGLDDEFVEDVLAADLLKEKLLEQLNIEIGDDELTEYYNNNYYHAKHILILDSGDDEAAAKEKADSVLAQVNAGGDFDALMNEYGEDPGVKNSPDGYTFTNGEMVEEFENTVKGLPVGSVGMCKSSFGYHIIKRLELDAAAMEDIKEDIRTELTNEKFISSLRDYAEEYNIKVKENDDKKAEIIENIKQEM